MTPELREKLAKLYELVKRGTDGERHAAERVLNGIIEKYNLQGFDLDALDKPLRKFKYSSQLEHWLFVRIVEYFIGKEVLSEGKRYLYKEKALGLPLTHLDYITVECAYEYFRRHMKKEWQRTCEPELKKCRKVKTRNKRRQQLQEIFYSRYIIASNLIDKSQLVELPTDGMSAQEMADRIRLANIEGAIITYRCKAPISFQSQLKRKKSVIN